MDITSGILATVGVWVRCGCIGRVVYERVRTFYGVVVGVWVGEFRVE